MKVVQPIRDFDTVSDIIDYLMERSQRDCLLFMTGVYTGLRISDILTLRVKDVRDKEYITIKEQKTKKNKLILVQYDLKVMIEEFIEDKKDNEYLFRSRQGRNKPITRQRAYKILREVAEEFHLKSIGTHTLRKTFGYHMYQRDKDVAMLQEIFNHHHQHDTLRYIGVSQDAIDKARNRLSFRKKRS